MKLNIKDQNIWFVSDEHHFHKNVIKYCKRPVCDIIEMHSLIRNNHNSVVGRDDIVFHLGDFCFGGSDKTKNMLSQLNGKHHLIRGNHDGFGKDVGFLTDQHFLEIQVRDDDVITDITLCHFALRVWNNSHRGAISLYGHSHGNLPGLGRQLDVGVDANNYFPISYHQVIEKLKDVKPSYVDHHEETTSHGTYHE